MTRETLEPIPADPSRAHRALDWVEELLAAFVLVVALFTFLVRVVTVSGASMSPTYDDGDRLVAVPWFTYQAGDVIVSGDDPAMIKRVIATEGQTVALDEIHGTVLIDGYPLDESVFGLENGRTGLPYASLERTRFPVTVPKGYVFVLGDNRPVSLDSRYASVGLVDCRSIRGRVVFRLWAAGAPSPNQ